MYSLNMIEFFCLVTYLFLLFFTIFYIKKYNPKDNSYIKIPTFKKIKKNNMYSKENKYYFYKYEFYVLMLNISALLMVGYTLFVIKYNIDFIDIPISFIGLTTFLYALVALTISLFAKSNYIEISNNNIKIKTFFKPLEKFDYKDIENFKYEENRLQIFKKDKLIYETIENDKFILYNFLKENK